MSRLLNYLHIRLDCLRSGLSESWNDDFQVLTQDREICTE